MKPSQLIANDSFSLPQITNRRQLFMPTDDDPPSTSSDLRSIQTQRSSASSPTFKTSKRPINPGFDNPSPLKTRQRKALGVMHLPANSAFHNDDHSIPENAKEFEAIWNQYEEEGAMLKKVEDFQKALDVEKKAEAERRANEIKAHNASLRLKPLNLPPTFGMILATPDNVNNVEEIGSTGKGSTLAALDVKDTAEPLSSFPEAVVVGAPGSILITPKATDVVLPLLYTPREKPPVTAASSTGTSAVKTKYVPPVIKVKSTSPINLPSPNLANPAHHAKHFNFASAGAVTSKVTGVKTQANRNHLIKNRFFNVDSKACARGFFPPVVPWSILLTVMRDMKVVLECRSDIVVAVPDTIIYSTKFAKNIAPTPKNVPSPSSKLSKKFRWYLSGLNNNLIKVNPTGVSKCPSMSAISEEGSAEYGYESNSSHWVIKEKVFSKTAAAKYFISESVTAQKEQKGNAPDENFIVACLMSANGKCQVLNVADLLKVFSDDSHYVWRENDMLSLYGCSLEDCNKNDFVCMYKQWKVSTGDAGDEGNIPSPMSTSTSAASFALGPDTKVSTSTSYYRNSLTMPPRQAGQQPVCSRNAIKIRENDQRVAKFNQVLSPFIGLLVKRLQVLFRRFVEELFISFTIRDKTKKTNNPFVTDNFEVLITNMTLRRPAFVMPKDVLSIVDAATCCAVDAVKAMVAHNTRVEVIAPKVKGWMSSAVHLNTAQIMASKVSSECICNVVEEYQNHVVAGSLFPCRYGKIHVHRTKELSHLLANFQLPSFTNSFASVVQKTVATQQRIADPINQPNYHGIGENIRFDVILKTISTRESCIGMRCNIQLVDSIVVGSSYKGPLTWYYSSTVTGDALNGSSSGSGENRFVNSTSDFSMKDVRKKFKKIVKNKTEAIDAPSADVSYDIMEKRFMTIATLHERENSPRSVIKVDVFMRMLNAKLTNLNFAHKSHPTLQPYISCSSGRSLPEINALAIERARCADDSVHEMSFCCHYQQSTSFSMDDEHAASCPISVTMFHRSFTRNRFTVDAPEVVSPWKLFTSRGNDKQQQMLSMAVEVVLFYWNLLRLVVVDAIFEFVCDKFGQLHLSHMPWFGVSSLSSLYGTNIGADRVAMGKKRIQMRQSGAKNLYDIILLHLEALGKGKKTGYLVTKSEKELISASVIAKAISQWRQRLHDKEQSVAAELKLEVKEVMEEEIMPEVEPEIDIFSQLKDHWHQTSQSAEEQRDNLELSPPTISPEPVNIWEPKNKSPLSSPPVMDSPIAVPSQEYPDHSSPIASPNMMESPIAVPSQEFSEHKSPISSPNILEGPIIGPYKSGISSPTMMENLESSAFSSLVITSPADIIDDPLLLAGYSTITWTSLLKLWSSAKIFDNVSSFWAKSLQIMNTVVYDKESYTFRLYYYSATRNRIVCKKNIDVDHVLAAHSHFRSSTAFALLENCSWMFLGASHVHSFFVSLSDSLDQGKPKKLNHAHVQFIPPSAYDDILDVPTCYNGLVHTCLYDYPDLVNIAEKGPLQEKLTALAPPTLRYYSSKRSGPKAAFCCEDLIIVDQLTVMAFDIVKAIQEMVKKVIKSFSFDVIIDTKGVYWLSFIYNISISNVHMDLSHMTTCSSCSSELNVQTKFCWNCGASIQEMLDTAKEGKLFDEAMLIVSPACVNLAIEDTISDLMPSILESLEAIEREKMEKKMDIFAELVVAKLCDSLAESDVIDLISRVIEERKPPATPPRNPPKKKAVTRIVTQQLNCFNVLTTLCSSGSADNSASSNVISLRIKIPLTVFYLGKKDVFCLFHNGEVDDPFKIRSINNIARNRIAKVLALMIQTYDEAFLVQGVICNSSIKPPYTTRKYLTLEELEDAVNNQLSVIEPVGLHLEIFFVPGSKTPQKEPILGSPKRSPGKEAVHSPDSPTDSYRVQAFYSMQAYEAVYEHLNMHDGAVMEKNGNVFITGSSIQMNERTVDVDSVSQLVTSGHYGKVSTFVFRLNRYFQDAFGKCVVDVTAEYFKVGPNWLVSFSEVIFVDAQNNVDVSKTISTVCSNSELPFSPSKDFVREITSTDVLTSFINNLGDEKTFFGESSSSADVDKLQYACEDSFAVYSIPYEDLLELLTTFGLALPISIIPVAVATNTASSKVLHDLVSGTEAYAASADSTRKKEDVSDNTGGLFEGVKDSTERQSTATGGADDAKLKCFYSTKDNEIQGQPLISWYAVSKSFKSFAAAYHFSQFVGLNSGCDEYVAFSGISGNMRQPLEMFTESELMHVENTCGSTPVLESSANNKYIQVYLPSSVRSMGNDGVSRKASSGSDVYGGDVLKSYIHYDQLMSSKDDATYDRKNDVVGVDAHVLCHYTCKNSLRLPMDSDNASTREAVDYEHCYRYGTRTVNPALNMVDYVNFRDREVADQMRSTVIEFSRLLLKIFGLRVYRLEIEFVRNASDGKLWVSWMHSLYVETYNASNVSRPGSGQGGGRPGSRAYRIWKNNNIKQLCDSLYDPNVVSYIPSPRSPMALNDYLEPDVFYDKTSLEDEPSISPSPSVINVKKMYDRGVVDLEFDSDDDIDAIANDPEWSEMDRELAESEAKYNNDLRESQLKEKKVLEQEKQCKEAIHENIQLLPLEYDCSKVCQIVQLNGRLYQCSLRQSQCSAFVICSYGCSFNIHDVTRSGNADQTLAADAPLHLKDVRLSIIDTLPTATLHTSVVIPPLDYVQALFRIWFTSREFVNASATMNSSRRVELRAIKAFANFVVSSIRSLNFGSGATQVMMDVDLKKLKKYCNTEGHRIATKCAIVIQKVARGRLRLGRYSASRSYTPDRSSVVSQGNDIKYGDLYVAYEPVKPLVQNITSSVTTRKKKGKKFKVDTMTPHSRSSTQTKGANTVTTVDHKEAGDSTTTKKARGTFGSSSFKPTPRLVAPKEGKKKKRLSRLVDRLSQPLKAVTSDTTTVIPKKTKRRKVKKPSDAFVGVVDSVDEDQQDVFSMLADAGMNGLEPTAVATGSSFDDDIGNDIGTALMGTIHKEKEFVREVETTVSRRWLALLATLSDCEFTNIRLPTVYVLDKAHFTAERSMEFTAYFTVNYSCVLMKSNMTAVSVFDEISNRRSRSSGNFAAIVKYLDGSTPCHHLLTVPELNGLLLSRTQCLELKGSVDVTENEVNRCNALKNMFRRPSTSDIYIQQYIPAMQGATMFTSCFGKRANTKKNSVNKEKKNKMTYSLVRKNWLDDTSVPINSLRRKENSLVVQFVQVFARKLKVYHGMSIERMNCCLAVDKTGFVWLYGVEDCVYEWCEKGAVANEDRPGDYIDDSDEYSTGIGEVDLSPVFSSTDVVSENVDAPTSVVATSKTKLIPRLKKAKSKKHIDSVFLLHSMTEVESRVANVGVDMDDVRGSQEDAAEQERQQKVVVELARIEQAAQSMREVTQAADEEMEDADQLYKWDHHLSSRSLTPVETNPVGDEECSVQWPKLLEVLHAFAVPAKVLFPVTFLLDQCDTPFDEITVMTFTGFSQVKEDLKKYENVSVAKAIDGLVRFSKSMLKQVSCEYVSLLSFNCGHEPHQSLLTENQLKMLFRLESEGQIDVDSDKQIAVRLRDILSEDNVNSICFQGWNVPKENPTFVQGISGSVDENAASISLVPAEGVLSNKNVLFGSNASPSGYRKSSKLTGTVVSLLGLLNSSLRTSVRKFSFTFLVDNSKRIWVYFGAVLHYDDHSANGCGSIIVSSGIDDVNAVNTVGSLVPHPPTDGKSFQSPTKRLRNKNMRVASAQDMS